MNPSEHNIRLRAPKVIDGVEVEPVGTTAVVRGVRWVTLCPVDDDDFRIWEWSPDADRIIQTCTGDDSEVSS